MSTEEYKMDVEEKFPIVYTQTRAYVMMVSADVYKDKVAISDPNINPFRSDLYMVPYNEQAWAIFDFITKNSAKFQDDHALELFGTSKYNRDCTAADFVDARCAPVTAGMRPGHQLGGHADAQTIVVFQTPAQMRKVRFTEIAFERPAVIRDRPAVPSGWPAAGGSAGGSAGGRAAGGGAAGGGAAGGRAAGGGAAGGRAGGGPSEAGSDRSESSGIFGMKALLTTL
jgi:uncharacterized membrane protein YgcG